MDTSWIKLYRKARDNDIMQDPVAWTLFCYILMTVNRENGSMKTGRIYLSAILKIDQSTIYKAIKRLVAKYKLIELSVTTKYTEIIVLKWAMYQNTEVSGNNKVTTKEQQSNTIQEERSKNIYNNAELPEDGSDLEKLLVEGNNKGITQEFQLFGLEMWKQLHAPVEKKSECLRIAKLYPRDLVTRAFSFAIDYPKQDLKWKMFLWKLNQVRKEQHERSKIAIVQE